MIESRWNAFRADALAQGVADDPDDRWVEYRHPLANPRSAQSTAGIMRLRFPELEFKTRKGIVYARIRTSAAQEGAGEA